MPIIILLLLLIPSLAFSAPAITGVSGTITNGSSVTITGTGFGTKSQVGPLISSYDCTVSANNFDNTATGSAPSGNWAYGDATHVDNSATYRRTTLYQDRKYLECPYDHGSPYSQINYNAGVNSGHTFYFSYWIYLTASSWSITGNSKFWRQYAQDLGDGDVHSWYARFLCGDANPCPVNYVSVAADGSNVPSQDQYSDEWGYLGYQHWIHYEIYSNLGTANNTDGWVRPFIDGRAMPVWNNGLITSSAPHTGNIFVWGQVSGPASAGNGILISQLYLDNTVAHVIISDSSNYSFLTNTGGAAHTEIQVPSAWSDSSITVTVNRGTFGATANAYLYIIDSAGAISPARAITFGDTAVDITPDQFTFTDATGAELSTQSTSNTVILAAFDNVIDLTISGTGCQYSKNGGTYTSGGGTAVVNDNISVRTTSAATYSTPVSCTFNAGNTSDTYTVTTKATPDVDVTPPFRYGGSPTGVLASGTTQATVLLTTSDSSLPASCRYSNSPNQPWAGMTAFTTSDGTNHSYVRTGLIDGGSYTSYIKCQDSAAPTNTNPDDYPISWSVASGTPPPPSPATMVGVTLEGAEVR